MIRKFIPSLKVQTVFDIPMEELFRQGYKAVITDLDNTLVGAKDPLATPKLLSWLKELESAEFKVLIVSNNNETRVATFANPLGLPFIHSARKPRLSAFRHALSILGSSPKETIMIGDQLMTDVFGGNRMGLYTVLVDPVSMADEGFGTRINRRLEKFVRARLRKKGLHWEEKQ
ncbi:YqeG family HAD IIIA-type phosphatase [Marinicrinis lubricantis]|uniref:YqeG family HAD IIIA-type phosphatase n=1 Tax=Marinicrinis lubricantis TaxID=2086470 RepID=A0ABW1IUV4_9BACL